MRAMQRTQFCAKSARNYLKPTYFLNCNFYFETEGVGSNILVKGFELHMEIKV